MTVYIVKSICVTRTEWLRCIVVQVSDAEGLLRTEST